MLFAIYMTANIIQKCKQSVLSVVKWDVLISKIWRFLDQKELWIDIFRFSNLSNNHVGGIGKNVGIVDVLGYRSKMDCSFKSGKWNPYWFLQYVTFLIIVDGITRCDRNNYFLYSRLRRHIYLTAWLNSWRLCSKLRPLTIKWK